MSRKWLLTRKWRVPRKVRMLKVCIFVFYSKASLKSGLLGKHLVTNLHQNLSTGSTYEMRKRFTSHKKSARCDLIGWIYLITRSDQYIWSAWSEIKLTWSEINLIWSEINLIWSEINLIWSEINLICLIRIKRPDGNLKRIFNPAAICTLVEDDWGTTHWSLQLFK